MPPDAPAEEMLQNPYHGTSVWVLQDNKIHVRVCKIPHTEHYLWSSCDLFRFAEASWDKVNVDCLEALHASLSREITNRRRGV